MVFNTDYLKVGDYILVDSFENIQKKFKKYVCRDAENTPIDSLGETTYKKICLKVLKILQISPTEISVKSGNSMIYLCPLELR